MKEREVLNWLGTEIDEVGDDCAVIPFRDTHLILTIDMLWEETDFPAGITPYTIGWRAVAVSLSDIAAMGARPLGVVAALGAPEFKEEFLRESLKGGQDCCERVGTRYVGGDLSNHQQLTLTSSALGEAPKPVMRSGASHGDRVCVTGRLGRTAVALRLFETDQQEEANRLFQFIPRVQEGLQLAPIATSMMDISDGLARSLYQVGTASGVGFRITEANIPVCNELGPLTTDREDLREAALYTGEDFELLFTINPDDVERIPGDVEFAVIGDVVREDQGIVLHEEAETGGIVILENRGYEHG